MEKRDWLFWIFAILQGYFVLNYLEQTMQGSSDKIIEFVLLILFVISIIGIEYLIYSKK